MVLDEVVYEMASVVMSQESTKLMLAVVVYNLVYLMVA